MKRLFISSVALALASLLTLSCGPPASNTSNTATTNNANAGNTATSTASADTDVKKLMSELAAVLAKNDADAASKFYADDYHLVNPEGVDQNKAARLADMKSGITKFDSFSYEDVNVRTYGDTAIAIATVKAKGVVNGKPRTGDMRATLVLRKMADGWKVVSGQATPIAATSATTSNTATSTTNATGNANAAGNANKTAAPANK